MPDLYSIGVIVLLGSIAAFADVLPGFFFFNNKKIRQKVRYLVALAAGTVLGAAFFELLPDSVSKTSEWGFYLVGLGFVVFYAFEKMMMLHSCGEQECTTHKVSGLAVLGMATDNVLDGFAIGVGFLLNPITGLIILLAVVVHEFPQGITSAIILKKAGYSKKKIYYFLAITGLVYPLSALAAAFVPQTYFDNAVAVIAGVFIYIGASDLLAEAHKKFNKYVVATVILGVVLVALLERLLPH